MLRRSRTDGRRGPNATARTGRWRSRAAVSSTCTGCSSPDSTGSSTITTGSRSRRRSPSPAPSWPRSRRSTGSPTPSPTTGFTDHVRYHSIRDVPVLLEAAGDQWHDAVDRHVRWHGLLARGIDVVWEHFDLSSHPIRDWAAQVRPGRRERFALGTFELAGSRQHWGGVAAIAPWRWSGLLAPITVPSREYLAHHDRTRWGHVRATVGRVRPTPPRRSDPDRR